MARVFQHLSKLEKFRQIWSHRLDEPKDCLSFCSYSFCSNFIFPQNTHLLGKYQHCTVWLDSTKHEKLLLFLCIKATYWVGTSQTGDQPDKGTVLFAYTLLRLPLVSSLFLKLLSLLYCVSVPISFTFSLTSFLLFSCLSFSLSFVQNFLYPTSFFNKQAKVWTTRRSIAAWILFICLLMVNDSRVSIITAAKKLYDFS